MSRHMILSSRLHVPPSRARRARALSVESVESLESRTLLNGASLFVTQLFGYAAIVESLRTLGSGHAAITVAAPVAAKATTTPTPVAATPPRTISNPVTIGNPFHTPYTLNDLGSDLLGNISNNYNFPLLTKYTGMPSGFVDTSQGDAAYNISTTWKYSSPEPGYPCCGY